MIKYETMIEADSTKHDKEETASLPYKPLSPTDNAEGCEVYFEALSWALSNKEYIKNIAISGPYGSGKSSIIQTFIRREEEKKCFLRKSKNHFLNISLATFEPPKNAAFAGTGTNGTDEKNDIQRLIELSLLQQLFFREEYSKTPDSRLKKIKRQKTWELVLISIAFMAFFFPTFSLFFPKKFSELCVGIDLTSPILRYITLNLFLVGLFYIFYKSSRSLISLSIKKLNLKGDEIEIDKNISKSLLNHHIDEIIYFFEVTDYNVVIIEDLDRFGESEVFTKLREINLLINNSKKISRDIVFVYAIKDDMFKDKDRAKFLDRKSVV